MRTCTNELVGAFKCLLVFSTRPDCRCSPSRVAIESRHIKPVRCTIQATCTVCAKRKVLSSTSKPCGVSHRVSRAFRGNPNCVCTCHVCKAWPPVHEYKSSMRSSNRTQIATHFETIQSGEMISLLNHITTCFDVVVELGVTIDTLRCLPIVAVDSAAAHRTEPHTHSAARSLSLAIHSHDLLPQSASKQLHSCALEL